MTQTKLFHKVQEYILPMMALLLIITFYTFCICRLQTEFPVLYPEDGILDVRSVDFEDGVYHILNQWDYYSGRLLWPGGFDGASAPGKDSSHPLDPNLGTWRLRILGIPGTYLSLCGFSIDYSTRIFVNGRQARNVGFVSEDPSKAVPGMRYVTLPLYFDESGEIEIIYQYANFVHNDGGFIQNTLISTPENLDEYQRGLTLNAMVVSGGLLMLCFYFLLSAAFQRNLEYAALSLCSLVIALRNQLFFSEHLLPRGCSFFVMYRLVVLDVSWIPMSTVFLLATFCQGGNKGGIRKEFLRNEGILRGKGKLHLPSEKTVLLVFSGLCLILSALHWALDTHDLVSLCHVCYYCCLPFGLWILFRRVYSFREQRPGGLDLLTLLSILFFIFMLIREGLATGSDSSVNHFGVTPLAMLVCILLLAMVNNEKIRRQALYLQEEKQRNELLRQMNSAGTYFLRFIAHELKTPLTVISGYAQLIGRQLEVGALSMKTPERLKTIQSESDRLAEMVTRLMDYSKGRREEVQLAAVDVEDLLHSVLAIMSPVCAKKSNTLSCINKCASRIHGNKELLLQVLINLIVNANRHTSEGAISIRAQDAEGLVEVWVSDTGEGIAPEVVPHIFEKNYSADGGGGLGLWICRDIAQMHQGMVELVTTSGEGTTFRLTLPREDKP